MVRQGYLFGCIVQTGSVCFVAEMNNICSACWETTFVCGVSVHMCVWWRS